MLISSDILLPRTHVYGATLTATASVADASQFTCNMWMFDLKSPNSINSWFYNCFFPFSLVSKQSELQLVQVYQHQTWGNEISNWFYFDLGTFWIADMVNTNINRHSHDSAQREWKHRHRELETVPLQGSYILAVPILNKLPWWSCWWQ